MIGDPVSRLDGRLKVTGGARYSAEWPLARMAYGVIVQSTIARGTIEHCDDAAARAEPGVISILTPFNAPRLPSGGRAAVEPPSGRVLSLLQDRDVQYNGQPVALVIAETFEQATYAASLVVMKYRTEIPAASMAAALPHAQIYTAKIQGQEPSARRGDIQAGLAAASAVVDAVYTTPLETHNAMEPHATVAEWTGDDLLLYDATQYVYGVKRFVAKTFGIPEQRVRVVSKFTGGAFGSKGSAWSHVVLAAMAARQVQRPVKVVLTRRQMFGLVGARPYTSQRLVVAATAEGRFTAITQDVTSSTSTLEDWVETSTMQTRMLYAVPNLQTQQKLVRLNIGTPTFNRGPGESSGTFGLESAIDELAVSLGLDPIALRLTNYADADPETGKPWSSKSLRECYEQGAAKFGWSRRSAAPRSMRDGRALVGFGMASATYPTKRQRASATARLMPDGTVQLDAATHEFGTGTYTSMTQVAADAMGVPIGRVRFDLGDTTLPENPISAGSMTAASTGPAVRAAGMALVERVTALGGALADIAQCKALVTANGGPIEVTASAAPGPEAQQYSMHAFGAVFAEVRVDPDLGEIRVARVVGAYGAGKILNRKTATSQMQGGIIYGLSMALTEHTLVDARTGRYVNADFSEYHVPVQADVPAIDVVLIDEHDPYVNSLGVKGIGEIGTTGVAAAVANAVYHATGIRVRDLPITLDRLL